MRASPPPLLFFCLVFLLLVPSGCGSRDPVPSGAPPAARAVPTAGTPVLTAQGIGALTGDTPFRIEAVQMAFPGYQVVRESVATGAGTHPVLVVRDDDETLVTVYPDAAQEHIRTVSVRSPRVPSALGPPVGTPFADVFPDGPPTGCSPGVDARAGAVLCPASTSDRVTYIFRGAWDGPEGMLLPAEDLAAWTVAEIVWQARTPADRVAVEGTYAYDFGDRGTGTLRVTRLGPDAIHFSLEVVGPGPAHNQGLLEGTAPLNGLVARVEDPTYGDCRLDITFAARSAAIQTIDDAYACGFGHGVVPDGLYWRDAMTSAAGANPSM